MMWRGCMLEEFNNDCCLSIAGLDPSGGAGILADCKTIHAHNIYACCVVTCITAQNPLEVSDIRQLDVKIIGEEIDKILDVYPVEFVKTGMLYSEPIVKLVSRKIDEYNLKAVVDPVMISESGCDLICDDFANILNKHLIKKSYLITPNIHEAEQLSNIKIYDEEDMKNVAEYLSYDNNVVITGGHLNGNDILFYDDKINVIEGNIIDTKNTHGTGCTYSSALTCNLIQGHNTIESCIRSNKFIQTAIKNGYNYTPNQLNQK